MAERRNVGDDGLHSSLVEKCAAVAEGIKVAGGARECVVFLVIGGCCSVFGERLMD